MQKILGAHQFGPQRVDVLEHAHDDGAFYLVLVDDAIVTDPPLPPPPRLEDVVRIYAMSRARV